MEQKLVTIHLTNEYGDADFSPGVREHLTDYVERGWMISDVRPVGTSQSNFSAAWVVVLLSRQRPIPASPSAPELEPPG